MSLIVQKFGGTSVGTVEKIRLVAKKVSQYYKEGNRIVVVVSAMSGETNRLIGLAQEIQERPVPRELDVLLSTGEQVTISLLCMALHEIGLNAISFTGSQVQLLTDDAHTKARIRRVDGEKIRRELEENKVVVVAGFQGVDDAGNITTLGRGGSDTTAVALAAGLDADECQIYTDVDGVYTSDPRVVEKARRLSHISFDEMLEMASMGSKVLQIRAVEFAGKYNVPLRVMHSFQEGAGTLITLEGAEEMETPTIAGIAFNKDEAKVTLLGVPDTPGVAYQILGPVGDANIEVDVIVQNVAPDNSTDFTFTVSRGDLAQTRDVLIDVVSSLDARELRTDDTVAKVSVVGVGMRSHAGVASKMFETLSEAGINIQMITTSEIKISVIIDEKYLELAVRSLHTAFDLDGDPPSQTGT